METIYIKDLAGRDILGRIAAHDILSAAYNCRDNEVVMDFDEVQFTTRSFMDEFYNEVRKASASGLKITLENMSDDLKHMYSAVSKTQKGGTVKITMKPYSRPKTIADMERIFAQLSI